jgi:hypothetical protein
VHFPCRQQVKKKKQHILSALQQGFHYQPHKACKAETATPLSTTSAKNSCQTEETDYI